MQSNKGRRWFTSDLHFFHKNILKYTERHKVVDEKNHNEWLINIWNADVKPEDTVFHLGDFAFRDDDKSLYPIMNALNGNIVMIRGNHDSNEAWKYYRSLTGVTTRDYAEINIQGTKVVMFHFPIEIWNKQHRGAWHLHGHSHGSFQKPTGKILDVGIDNAYLLYGKHRMFSEQDIVDYMQKREPSGQLDHHGERD